MVKEGQTFKWPGGMDNREVKIEDVGSGESGQLGAMAGDGEVELDRSIGNPRSPLDRGTVQPIDDLREAIDPEAIQRRRSAAAREADVAKDAPITTDPLEWASDPAGLDFPGVDTGPTFREEEGDNFDTDSLLDFR